MQARHGNHLTPWVGRLMAVNLAVLVLLLTVFTAPRFTAALQFDPTTPWTRYWTAFTHVFVHVGPLHLAVNLLVLWIFGPAVEERIGGRRFLLLYLSCGIGTALFALGLTGVAVLPPLAGAGGAVLGVALAAALLKPDAQIEVFPLPVPLSAATAVAILGVLDLVAAFRFSADGISHFAHFGGVITAYAWFRLRQLGPAVATTPRRETLHTVMAAPRTFRQQEGVAVTPPPQPRAETALASAEFERVEMDRVLDKISSSGLDSLTAAERRFLNDAAERRSKRHD